LPEHVARGLLSYFFPHRHDEGIPKFPAYYHSCKITRKTYEMIRSCGFASVNLYHFFGHNYFKNIPFVRSVDRTVSRIADARNLTWLASYSYSIARKTAC
jgi:hypothetical protein